ncbi:aminoglycoside phosphotransferase family protein [Nocardia sp. NPDC051832]|uniref:aminoglycoside phosphotransferase family protein n=1 Tax=Nocardia sp. NPDC051832 TaxID=3155673 RepID=UPI00344879E1
MGRTVQAWVTSGSEFLGVTTPFAVDIPWWAEVEPVVDQLEHQLGVPVWVLRLLSNDGGESGCDGHVVYHVEALRTPVPGLLNPSPGERGRLCADEPMRVPWARVDGLRELLAWAHAAAAAAGRPVTGPMVQRRTWNLGTLCRLPTTGGPLWLKATPHFAADEAAVIAGFAATDPSLVPRVLARGDRRILMDDIPGQDCTTAAPATVHAVITRFVAAQATLIARRPAGLRDWRPEALAARVRQLLDGPVRDELTACEHATAYALAGRWEELAECGLPDTVVHGDFHPGNWRSGAGAPVVLDFADSHWGNPVLDGLRAYDYLPEPLRATAVHAWTAAWSAHVPNADPGRALAVAEPLAHLVYAVRYQEFLDGIEPDEHPYHRGDPATAIRHAVHYTNNPSPHLQP